MHQSPDCAGEECAFSSLFDENQTQIKLARRATTAAVVSRRHVPWIWPGCLDNLTHLRRDSNV